MNKELNKELNEELNEELTTGTLDDTPACGGIGIETLSVRRYKVGYEVRTEKWSMPECPDAVIRSAYTADGQYIGEPIWAHRLFRRGIKPQRASDAHSVCSVGYCEADQMWYGWSHRALAGFGVGSSVTDGDVLAPNTDAFLYFPCEGKAALSYSPVDTDSLPVGYTSSSLDDAKFMAYRFAKRVS